MENLFNIDFGKLKVDQLGFVFKDIKKQARIMESIFGFSQFIFGDEDSINIKYRGKDSRVVSTMAFSRLGTTQIEIIQWKEGECTYKEFLDERREGFHHIAMYIEDMNEYIEKFRNEGIEVLQSGEVLKTRFAYMDTEKIFGTIVELLENVRRRKKKK